MKLMKTSKTSKAQENVFNSTFQRHLFFVFIFSNSDNLVKLQVIPNELEN